MTLKEYLAEFYHQFLEMEEFPEEETDDLHRGDWQYFNKTKESFRWVCDWVSPSPSCQRTREMPFPLLLCRW